MQPVRDYELKAFFAYVTEVLERLGIPYMVVGGFAAIIYGEPAERAEEGLAPLAGMGAKELRVLVEAVLGPGRQKNRSGTLPPEEEISLDRLLAEADRVALLKARALYTTQVHGVALKIDK